MTQEDITTFDAKNNSVHFNLDGLQGSNRIELSGIVSNSENNVEMLHLEYSNGKRNFSASSMNELSDLDNPDFEEGVIINKKTEEPQKIDSFGIEIDGKKELYDIDELSNLHKNTDGLEKINLNDVNVMSALLEKTQDTGRLLTNEEVKDTLIQKAEDHKEAYEEMLKSDPREAYSEDKPSPGSEYKQVPLVAQPEIIGIK